MRRPSVSLLVLLALIAGLVLGPTGTTATAGSSVGSFEIDGNLADDSGTGEPIDWDTPPPNLVNFTDASGKGDDVFGQGSKELQPGGWTCLTGSAPAKDDIVGGQMSIRAVGTKRFMYVNFTRLGVNGDAHIDYEFNQSDEPNPACPELPRRTNGDVVITFDTELGGKTIIVRAFSWTGTATSGTFTQLALGSQGVIWDGAVNIPNTIPGHTAGDFGEAAINLTDLPLRTLCPRSVYMKTRASTSITSELKDRTAAMAIQFGDHPELANAHDSAFGAHVADSAAALDQTLVPVSSSQSGVGSDSDSDQVLNVSVPPTTGEDLRADVLRTSSTSTVSNSPSQAVHTSIAEAINVDVLNGLVTASLVRGIATTTATGSAASFSSIGSAFKDLKVMGAARNTVNPNDRVDLPAAVFGAGSYILLYERIGSTATPSPGQLEGGTYAADLTVNMINVHITDKLPGVPGDQPLDVVVSNTVAHSDFPQTELCQLPSTKTVSGHAFIASETTDPALLPVLAGFVSIPATGGDDVQTLDSVRLPEDGSAVSADAADSRSTGSIFGASTATSFAEAESVCVLASLTGCTVSATSVKSQANSTADGTSASSGDAGTTLVNVVVGGTPVGGTPPPNTVVPLDGLGFVVLNEQVCDGAAALSSCAGTTSTGLTVRAVHVVITVPGNPLGLMGSEVIVAEAHSDATFVPASQT